MCSIVLKLVKDNSVPCLLTAVIDPLKTDQAIRMAKFGSAFNNRPVIELRVPADVNANISPGTSQ